MVNNSLYSSLQQDNPSTAVIELQHSLADSSVQLNHPQYSAIDNEATVRDTNSTVLPDEKGGHMGGDKMPHERKKGRWLVGGGAAGILALALVIALPVALVTDRHNNKNDVSSGNSGGSGNGGGSGSGDGNDGSNLAITGGNGSTVTMDNGTTFTYTNDFGGYWVFDKNDPFNDNATPNTWTPPLNTSWDWGKDKVYGTNLGGWLVLEPFITPAFYEKYQPQAVDEWTLSQAMAADTSYPAGSGLSTQLTDHYETFITEQDIAQIAGAGLNWVRLALPFWAIDTWDGEPFLPSTSWTYALRLFKWARKYGIRVNLDLHTIPGSQNAFNHSGKEGQVNFMVGVMGYANAQRALNYMRIIAEFVSQPQYRNVVPMFSFLNEPLVNTIGKDQISTFYFQVYTMLRAITGIGAGHGPFLAIHDGFQPTDQWAGFFPGADRLMLDLHPYICFNGQPNGEPVETWAKAACNTFGPGMLTSQTAFGVTVAGEFSAAYNDCGYFLYGPGTKATTTANCTFWQDASLWDAGTVQDVRAYVEASMDSMQNWFYWTWKIANSNITGRMSAPLWSYSAGLAGGWIPADPRTAYGACSSLGSPPFIFTDTYALSQTGGASSATLDAEVTQSFGQWPPTNISGVGAQVTLAPSYTPTGTINTLPPASLTPTPTKSVDVGDGWTDDSDKAGGMTTVAGCTYPNAWDSAGAVLPAAACTGT